MLHLLLYFEVGRRSRVGALEIFLHFSAICIFFLHI